MGKIRDGAGTRARILDAAAQEFARRGYDGAVLSAIAERARVSKQLVLHHFANKESLFEAVLDVRYRTTLDGDASAARDPGELIAERFRKRAEHLDFIRFMTWEAASADARTLPAHEARQQRVAELGAMLRSMQTDGRLPADLDHRLLQLAVLSLCTYPLAFGQITQLVTGRAPTDRRFQDDWAGFLQLLGRRLFAPSARAKRRRARRSADPGARLPAVRPRT